MGSRTPIPTADELPVLATGGTVRSLASAALSVGDFTASTVWSTGKGVVGLFRIARRHPKAAGVTVGVVMVAVAVAMITRRRAETASTLES